MRVLHLFSNHKWTGPAEPALNLCLALRERGVEVDFACSPGPVRLSNKIIEHARDRGLEPLLDFYLMKHRHPWRNFYDRWALKRHLRQQDYDLIHCHLDNDHNIASRVAPQLGIPVIRSSYAGLGLPKGPRHRRVLQRTDWLIEPSEIACNRDAGYFGFPLERMSVVAGAVDTERFSPTRQAPEGRKRLNLPPTAIVFGIVARMQMHRHFSDLFEAFRGVADELPEAHLVVVGRGTRRREVAQRPVEELGLEQQVHFAGYLEAEEYVGMLQALDVGLFLVPGTDGTCRAAREMMACGKPMIVADRGMLREIVHDGRDGLLTDGMPHQLEQTMLRLGRDRQLRHEMGRAARDTAAQHYSLDAQSAAVLKVYEKLLSGAGA